MITAELPHATSDVAFMQSPLFQEESYLFGVYSRLDKTHQKTTWAELETSIIKINEFSNMKKNWDGYGALPIHPTTKENAINCLKMLSRITLSPDIIPNPNGTLSFEWETNTGIAHLEIGRTKFSFYIKPHSGNPLLADGEANQISSDLGEWLNKLLFPQYCMDTMQDIRFSVDDT